MSTAVPPTLLATDLDGTLLDRHGGVTPRTREALQAARESGIEVVFVTGRPPQWLGAIADETGHRGDVLCANGAMVYSLGAMAPVSVATMAQQDAAQIVTRLREHDPDAEFRTLLHRSGSEPLRVVGPAATHGEQLHEQMSSEWLPFKMAVISSDPAHSPESFHRLAVSLVGDLASMTYSSSSTPLLEVGPRGVDKGTALRDYVAARGIPLSAVHAVGDMPNDLPMLSWAPQSYAVANAHPQVLAAAGRTLAHHEHDPVAQLLEELIERRSSHGPASREL